ncbi:hypothetical protein VTK73DRAFT_352 [Phialemonium thermophilum]|uniref:Uncharacterized protein n=1 Tax=Phialemonium thermophilum TaxID=223376 RepID=A0ABR3VVL1_9PEZI
MLPSCCGRGGFLVQVASVQKSSHLDLVGRGGRGWVIIEDIYSPYSFWCTGTCRRSTSGPFLAGPGTAQLRGRGMCTMTSRVGLAETSSSGPSAKPATEGWSDRERARTAIWEQEQPIGEWMVTVPKAASQGIRFGGPIQVSRRLCGWTHVVGWPGRVPTAQRHAGSGRWGDVPSISGMYSTGTTKMRWARTSSASG